MDCANCGKRRRTAGLTPRVPVRGLSGREVCNYCIAEFSTAMGQEQETTKFGDGSVKEAGVATHLLTHGSHSYYVLASCEPASVVHRVEVLRIGRFRRGRTRPIPPSAGCIYCLREPMDAKIVISTKNATDIVVCHRCVAVAAHLCRSVDLLPQVRVFTRSERAATIATPRCAFCGITYKSWKAVITDGGLARICRSCTRSLYETRAWSARGEFSSVLDRGSWDATTLRARNMAASGSAHAFVPRTFMLQGQGKTLVFFRRSDGQRFAITWRGTAMPAAWDDYDSGSAPLRSAASGSSPHGRRCIFCGQGSAADRPMAVSRVGDAATCSDCVAVAWSAFRATNGAATRRKAFTASTTVAWLPVDARVGS